MRRTIPILFALVLVACSGGQKKETLDATRAGLGTAAEATLVAHDVFRAWSKAHEANIVSNAKSFEDGRARLDAFRAEADKVQARFDVVADTIKAAADAVALARADREDVSKALSLARKALTSVLALKQTVSNLERSSR